MEKVRVVQSPISGKMLVILQSGDMTDLARTAASIARQFPEAPVEASMDFGKTVALITAEERTGKNMTAVDFFAKIWEARGGGASSWMFDAAQAQGGTVAARFSTEAPATVSIFNAALDAALLSREFGNAPVEFEFRNRKITVTGSTDPETIEKSMPENLRTRGEYVPPPRQYHSVKDYFNVTAAADGSVSATYKDPGQAQKHIYYIADDLTNLSHEFNGKPVSYVHAGHAITVTATDEPENVAEKIPARDQWPAGPKR